MLKGIFCVKVFLEVEDKFRHLQTYGRIDKVVHSCVYKKERKKLTINFDLGV